MVLGGIVTIFMVEWYQSAFGEIHWMPMRYHMLQGAVSWSWTYNRMVQSCET